MLSKEWILGIDTSNYTTSLAMTDINGSIKADRRKLLTVRPGERGLRQSHALFQHMENLPELILSLFHETDRNKIAAVAASGKPRPVDGSYMPVFKAGLNYGKVMAASLGVPFFEFSHQEGHLEAVLHGSVLDDSKELLAYHLSGGTCELLHVRNAQIEILGGTKDLSFGQVIDRIGVALDMKFPAGQEMDSIAVRMRNQKEKFTPVLKKIPITGSEINLSGIETQCRRALENGANPELAVYELFQKISSCLHDLTIQAMEKTGCRKVLITGGVAASQFIREEFQQYFSGNDPTILFGEPALSSDNAVGISFLGGKALWQSNR